MQITKLESMDNIHNIQEMEALANAAIKNFIPTLVIQIITKIQVNEPK